MLKFIDETVDDKQEVPDFSRKDSDNFEVSPSSSPTSQWKPVFMRKTDEDKNIRIGSFAGSRVRKKKSSEILSSSPIKKPVKLSVSTFLKSLPIFHSLSEAQSSKLCQVKYFFYEII